METAESTIAQRTRSKEGMKEGRKDCFNGRYKIFILHLFPTKPATTPPSVGLRERVLVVERGISLEGRDVRERWG